MAPKDASVEFRCATIEKVFFEEAAAREGLSLSMWMRAVAHQAALKTVVPEIDVDGPAASFLPGFGLNEET